MLANNPICWSPCSARVAEAVRQQSLRFVGRAVGTVAAGSTSLRC